MNDPISWKHVTVYLSGPMEFAKDGGVEWRREIEQRLRDNLGIQESNILNPCDKPNVYGFRSLADEIAVQHTLREKEDWAELDKTMKRIMTIDLRLVDRSDIVIAYLPADTKMAGTIHEIVVARGQKKPVVAIVPHGMKSMSGWMMALIGHRRCFDTIDKAVAYLTKIKRHGASSAKDAKEFVIFDLDHRESERV